MQVLATHNFSQLKAVFDEYAKISGHPIEKAIESEFSGDCRDGFMAVIKCVRNRNAFFAELLYNSMKVSLLCAACFVSIIWLFESYIVI